MAKRNDKEEKLNYALELKELKRQPPERLYLLWGPEDYLREQFLAEIKKLCLPDGDEGFSFRRIDGPELPADLLQEALDAMPFMTERTFVELRNIDINKLKDSERINKLLSDIPDYCTVVFSQSAAYELDGRLKSVKGLRGLAHELKFTSQSQGALTSWIVRRFAAANKSIELEAVQRLMFISGQLMNRLIPEIDKISAYAKDEKVTVADVEAVANHIPEAVIFDMTELISQKQYNSASAVLAELLAEDSNEPIPMLAMLGLQMRKLYAARLAIDMNLGKQFVMDSCALKYDFLANKLLNAARGYTLPQLKRAVELCCETDYKIKSSSQNDVELLKEVVFRIAAGEKNA